MKNIKYMKSQTAPFSYQVFTFTPNIYRMLTFVYNDDDDNVTINTNTDDDDKYMAIALAKPCLSSVLKP